MMPARREILSLDWPEPSHFRKSIRLKFTVYVSVIMITLMLVTGYVISGKYAEAVTLGVVDRILVQARSYSGPAAKMLIYGEAPDVLSLNNMCRRITSDNPGVFWAGITGEDGRFLAHTNIKQVVNGTHMRPVSTSQFHATLRTGEAFEVRGDTIYASVPVEQDNLRLGRMVVAASSEPVKRARTSSILAVASITAFMVLAGIPMTILILRRTLRPIGLITEHLKRADLEDISQGLPFRSSDEFGFLAETIRVLGSRLGLARKELVEKERMSRDLEIAREIQSRILPRGYPVAPSFQLAGTYRSALEVGGDYYDFVEFDDHNLGILIADVSGKSLPGMLVMLLTRDIVKRLARSVRDPAGLLAKVNAEVLQGIKKGMFVTMFFGMLNTRSGQFRFASAGHNPLILLRAAEPAPDLIKTKGFPLGMVETQAYRSRIENACVSLSPGDWIVLYTDGINEARNADGREFGMNRFLELICRNRGASGEDLVEEVLREHAAFVGQAQQSDDLTMIAVKWLGRTADKNNDVIGEQADAAGYERETMCDSPS